MKTRKPSGIRNFFRQLLAAGICVQLIGAAMPLAAAERDDSAKRPAREPATIVLDTNALPSDSRGITSFAPVVKKVAPSVVTIYSTKTVRDSMRMNPFDDPMFRRFFGLPPGEEDEGAPAPRGRGDRPPQGRERTVQSLGSGVIISADGYILSNNHVIEGADEVKVALSSGDDEIVAKVIGSDPQTDISVLKIDRTGLPPITMTDSSNLQVGDVVLAIGNPFNVGQTVTMGIVSATGRGFRGMIASYEDFIQTDAAINMGNSGGALVDAHGRLVGINTAIMSRTGGNMGIGFAVPINMARGVMDSIIQHGRVTRGFLGIQLSPEIEPSMAKAFGLKDRSGALVDDVTTNSPASKAGFRPGDVIVEFNGRKVPDSRQLRLWVSQTPPGNKSTMKIIRDGKERTITATLGEFPSDLARLSRGGQNPTPEESDVLDGVEVGDMDQRSRRQFEIPNSIRGALVTNVDPDSNAAEAGLRPGDVIVEIDRQKVSDAQEAIDLSKKLKNDQPILLRVFSARTGSTRFLVVEPEKSRETRPR